MVKPLDIAGQRFSRLIAVERHGTDAHGKVKWLFRCDCGEAAISIASDVKSGRTQSCGCLNDESRAKNARDNRDKIANAKTRHGGHDMPEYFIWKTMRQRCGNPNAPDYPEYGGRGISVCERWNLFENFIADMGRRPSPQHSVDRI